MNSARNEFRPARAMILAAGRGERLRPLSDRLPKALMEIQGRALIEHLLTALARAGVTKAVVNLCWLGAMIRDKLGSGTNYGLKIRYSDEGDSALDTGGGVKRALPLLGDEPFWVVNADVRTTFAFSARQIRPGDLAWLMLAPNPAHNPAGDFHLRSGRIGAGGPRYTFSGVSVLTPELFRNATEERFGPRPAAARGRR